MKTDLTHGVERALVVAPRGRDGAIAAAVLKEAGVDAHICANLDALVRELANGAGVAIVVEEALPGPGYARLVEWIEAQPAWSDLPVVLIASRGADLERNASAKRMVRALGNVSFLERPFHPTTLVSLVQAALRGRRRQYEARERLETIRAAEETLERRVAERTAELESANRQLAEQIGERERVESALHHAQRLEAVGQLTSGVAHDFNNLLMVVLGNVRQMQQAELDPLTERRFSMIVQAAERGAQLTAQMLAFSRRQKLDPRPVDLNETVQRMHDLLQSTMGGSVQLETELQADLWPAMIDPTQIELVILNLAINARDAMAVGGRLTVRTENVVRGEADRPEDPPPGEYVLVEVRDTGEGMTPEVLAKVFEPFFTTKEIGKGSGLGLSQVYGLAKQSGGGVRIESAPGVGASVQVYLPRSRTAPASATIEAQAAARDATADHKVLVVDDDDAVREVTASFLSELGYSVVEAGSGGAALELLDQQDSIELLLLDFAMPGMNGAELAREARARRPKLPIVFVTGYADAQELPQLGREEILWKPFNQEELATKVGAALRR